MKLANRIHSEFTHNEGRTVYTVSYKFRGSAEAERFKLMVDNLIGNFKEFMDESNDMDKFCEEHDCKEF